MLVTSSGTWVLGCFLVVSVDQLILQACGLWSLVVKETLLCSAGGWKFTPLRENPRMQVNKEHQEALLNGCITISKQEKSSF